MRASSPIRSGSMGTLILVGLAFGKALDVFSWALLLLALTGGVWGIWLGSLVGQKGWRWSFWAVFATLGVVFLAGWFG